MTVFIPIGVLVFGHRAKSHYSLVQKQKSLVPKDRDYYLGNVLIALGRAAEADQLGNLDLVKEELHKAITWVYAYAGYFLVEKGQKLEPFYFSGNLAIPSKCTVIQLLSFVVSRLYSSTISDLQLMVSVEKGLQKYIYQNCP